MINISGIPGRTAMVDEKEYLFFSGFAYLGMPSLPSFQQMLYENIQKYGAVFPSSRISNTRTNLYEQLEDKLSEYIGLPASACFSSGYMASQAAATVAAKNTTLIYAPGIHPSLKIPGADAIDLPPANWQEEAVHRINQPEQKPLTLVMESVNPLSGEIHDFSWLHQISVPFRLLIDDSHGIGVLGTKGEGIIGLLPALPQAGVTVCYSLSKAFSCEGGAVSGSEGFIRQVKKLPFFTASTPPAPAFASTWINAQELFAHQREKLSHNISFFTQKVQGIPVLRQHAQLPVCQITKEGVYEYCLKYHILLSAFRYPSEKDPLSARIVLNALHTEEDMERLIECITSFSPAASA